MQNLGDILIIDLAALLLLLFLSVCFFCKKTGQEKQQILGVEKPHVYLKLWIVLKTLEYTYVSNVLDKVRLRKDE